MKIYLVGGAVRDELMGRAITERDWVVVGGTIESMLSQGYSSVGKHFPVFFAPCHERGVCPCSYREKNFRWLSWI